MQDLALSVFFASLIFVIFKLYNTYRVETFYAIIANYFVASLCGFSFYNGDIKLLEIPEKKWFFGTLIIGILFIVIFNLMAATAQRIGVSVASVATKMSLVIPVIFGIFAYNELLSPIKIIGIILALVSVYFTSYKEKSVKIDKSTLYLPFLIFIGAGVIDTGIKYVQEVHLNETEFSLFSATAFGFAAISGLLYIIIISFKKPLQVNYKNIIGGIVLGIPNYYSIYFLMRALQNDEFTSAAIFTINNVAIVMVCTLLGIILFKEKISIKNWGGIVLAIISILLVALF
ncbi:GRP family sugar transporter [Aurantibacter sp.]|uniref:GRP family sugar transporter n=1 Tax=Aurantibacter sp. TaxID=2807103 RepID=UPI003265988E